ncbi:MAG: DUF1295 domain-containing protein [Verrucomicrobia bacterium]|nr:DUF1295 domain-containing protein [Kiritimatiellia bacterium]MCP5488882.1 DUF1295 domain-containing protein [Verrucomicrobiota bacterium]
MTCFLLWGLVVCCLAMSLLWVVQYRTLNAGLVDAGWASLIALLAISAAVWFEGEPVRRILPATMAALWGGRLAWLVHQRGHGKPEEGRYKALRDHWGALAQPKFFAFFQVQALAALLFSLPFVLTIQAGDQPFGYLEWIAIALWTGAFFGEATADRQLSRFKQNPDHRGKVCDQGLWRYSRHPNYFFEWLIWVSAALMAFPVPLGWVAIACPLAILFFLLRITGIPATEAQALRSKGEAYRRYQETTSRFIPLPPKS